LFTFGYLRSENFEYSVQHTIDGGGRIAGFFGNCCNKFTAVHSHMSSWTIGCLKPGVHRAPLRPATNIAPARAAFRIDIYGISTKLEYFEQKTDEYTASSQQRRHFSHIYIES